MYRILRCVKITLLSFVTVLCALSTAKAQETVNIDILNMPSVLPSPFISDFENQILGGRYLAQLNYMSAGTSPVELQFEVRLYRNNELLVKEFSRPESFNPGVHNLVPVFDYIRLERSVDEVIADLDNTLTGNILQSGTLPQGNYRVVIDAQPTAEQDIRINEAITDFTVTYPQPPRITSPADGADITISNPVFSWTPVITNGNFNIEYDFLLVEIFPGQYPSEAIDANRAHHQQTIRDANSLVYTSDFYPLEEGATYAWMITANDINDELPIRNNGESEIHTFTYHDDQMDPGEIADLNEIELVPGVVTLTGLQDLPESQITDTGSHLELNGSVEARFEMRYLGEPVYAEARMRNVQILKADLENPVMTRGLVDMNIYPISDDLLPGHDHVDLSQLEYRFPDGLTAQAYFEDVEFGRLNAEGKLSFSDMGPEGELTVHGQDLLTFQSDIMEVSLNDIRIDLPGKSVRGDGEVQLFGERAPCELRGVNLLNDELQAGWSCDQPRELNVAGSDDFIEFQLNRARGSLTLNREDQTLDYDLRTRASVNLDFENADQCGLQLTGNWQTESEPEFAVLQNTCTIPEPELDLGFVQLHLSDFDFNHFGYNPDAGSWDFDIPFYASITFPVFNDWQYAPEEPFRLTSSGLDIPGFEVSEETPDYKEDGLQLILDQVGMNDFVLLWEEKESWIDQWEMEFEGEASVAELSGLPSCLGNSAMLVENGLIDAGSLSADLELATFSDCSMEIWNEHKIIFSALGGSIYSEYQPDEQELFAATSDLFMEGRYEPGYPLTCSDDPSDQETTADISFTDGYAEGVIGIQDAGCEMPVGMMTAELEEAGIEFWPGEDGQEAHLAGQAGLKFSEDHQVSGNLVYDIFDMKFVELDFVIDEPFMWDLPSDDPLISFYIDEAELTLDGLFIDGRHEVHVGDESFGVTFDDVVQNIEERRIDSGEVFFDQSFALSVSFDEGFSSPEFSALPLPENGVEEAEDLEMPDNGLVMELGGEVGMDSTGVVTSGDANAKFALQDLDFDDVSVEFSDDFAFQVSPFGVNSGHIDFKYGGTRVAYLDASGFNPVISGFADEILPEKLPAPHTQVAYFKLRDEDGELLVDFEEPEPGLIELQTIPDSEVELVVPAFDESNPPAIAGVEFEDFVITATPGDFSVDSGNAQINLPDGDPLSDLAEQMGVPFDVSRISYGDTEELTDTGNLLQLAGDLNLFDHTIEAGENTLLTISSSGNLHGDFNLSDLDADVPMIGDSDLMQLTIRDVMGSLSTNVFSGGIGYDLDVGADLAFGSAGESEALSELELNLQPGTSVTVTEFSGIEPSSPVRVELPGFAMNLNKVESTPVFSYSREEGWDIELNLDADFEFGLSGYDPFTMPVNGIQLGTEGFTIPSQDINDSTLDGLELPSFDIAGFELQPLALRTDEDISFNWFAGEWPDISPVLDFELRLPDIGEGDLEPTDGFTFTDVSISDGVLSGEMNTYEPLGGIVIPTGPSEYNPPELRISEIEGALEAVESGGEMVQDVDLSVAGTVENIPFFEDEESGCDMDVTYELDVIAGAGFSGNIEALEPCGSVSMGPITMSAGMGSLYLSYDDDHQQAEFEGSVIAELQGPQNEVTAEGNLTLDLIQGSISDGTIDIDEPFEMPLPADGPSFMEFQVNEAEISSQGFMLDADGYLEAGETDVNVDFQQLRFLLPNFSIASGYAEVSAGFGLQVGFSPMSASIIDVGEDEPQVPLDDALVISAESAVTVDSTGLQYQGHAGASLNFGGEEFAALHAVFEDGFTYSMDSPAVKEGRARLYTDEDQNDLLAIYDSDGFDFGEAIVAQLPDTLGLPSSDIAYAVIKDEDGEPVVGVESNDGGGYTLETEDDPLTVYFPALEDDVEGEPYVDAYFTLTTDDSYIPNGGEITLSSPMSLEPYIDAPVSLDSIDVETGDQVELTTVLSMDLPEAFGGHEATVQTTIGSAGFQEAEIEAGEFVDSWDADIEPVVQHEIMSTMSGETGEDELNVGLLGARLAINSPAEFELAGFVETSFLETDDDELFPFFFTAGYADSGWNFDVEAIGELPSADMGMAKLTFDEHSPFDIVADQNEFIVEISGNISFEDMLGESLSFSVADMQIGTTNLQSSPELVFGIGGATAGLDDQEFDFFEGNLTGTIADPELSVSGRTFAASVSEGDVTFLGEELEYEGLYVDTRGDFEIDHISADEVELLGEYLKLESVGISREQDEALELSGQFGFTIPDPVDRYGNMVLAVSRGSDHAVSMDVDIPDDSPFNPEDEDIEIDLGSEVTLALNDVLVDVDLDDISASQVAVAGNVSFFGEERIWFGEAGSLQENPGISVKAGRNPMVRYNITGNADFEFEHSFFNIAIEGDVASSNEEAFEITLNGGAGLDISGVSGQADFENILITSSGIEDYGNFAGNAEFAVMNVATLELGTFIYESDDEGFEIDVAGGFDQDLDELEDAEEEMEQIEVVEYLCFGSCDGNGEGSSALYLSIGGESDGDSGSFGGGIEEVVFYEKSNGDISFTMRNLELSLGSSFSANAHLMYESTQTGNALFAAGSGQFDMGGTSAEAMIAGGFSNIDNELSFGIFTAVNLDVGFEVVPGIVSISGFGGGFFYRPQPDQLSMVMDAADNFRGDPPGDGQLTRATDGRPIDSADMDEDVDIKFSIMLYARLDLVGAGDANLVSGSTMLEITNKYIAFDADGTIMGMDSSPTVAGGTFFASVDRIGGLTIHAELDIYMDILRVVEVDGGVTFFVSEREDESGADWGLKATIGIDLLMMSSAQNTLLASNDGFYLDGGFSYGFSVGISVEASIEGAVWYLTYDEAQLPFGAYLAVSGEFDIIILSAEATLKGAFARKASDEYEFFAYGEVCGSILSVGTCRDAWISVWTTSSGFDYDGGRGSSLEEPSIIEQAKQQAEEFEQMVTEAIENIEADVTAPVAPAVHFDEEQLTQAGYNLKTATPVQKFMWRFTMLGNEARGDKSAADVPLVLQESLAYERSSTLDGFLDFGFREDSDLQDNPETSWSDAEDQVEAKLETIDNISEDVISRLDETVVKAIEIEEGIQELQDEAMTQMATNPATLLNDPGTTMSEGNLPEFQVDESMAEDQALSLEEVTEAIEEMENQVHAVVDTIEHNLSEMDNLIGLGDIGDFDGGEEPTFASISEYYAEALEEVDRYFALQANRYWHRVNMSELVVVLYEGRESQFDSAIETLLNNLVSAYNNRQADSQTFETEREMMAERIRLIEDLAEGASDISAPYDFSGFEAEMVYDSLGNDQVNYENFSGLEENIKNLWYDIHILGNEEYVDQKGQFIAGEFYQEHQDFRSSVTDLMEVNTELIDDFYNLKSNMLTSLYHIIDNYVQIREDAEQELGEELDDDMFTEYQSRRDEVLTSLEAPQISSITVDPDRENDYFFGYTDINWNASHPDGVADISLDIQQLDEEGDDIGDSNYLSIGNPSQYTHYAYPNDPVIQYQLLDFNEGATTQHINVGVRARSTGGVSSRLRAEFDMAVGPQGESTSPGENIIPTDTEPPANVMVDLDHYYNIGSETVFTGEFNPVTMQMDFQETEREAYWTSDPETIQIRVLVEEPETSIQEYRYMLGHLRGSESLLENTELIGDVEVFPDIPGNWDELLEAESRIINMEPGQEYYLTVEAINMNNQISRDMVARPIMYDDTPPDPPEPADQLIMHDFVSPFTQYDIETTEFLDSPPQYNLSAIQQSLRMYSNETPELQVSWEEATDEQSGISHYEYVVSADEDYHDSEFQNMGVTTTETYAEIISGEGEHQHISFDFDEEQYVHVRAINNAGLESDVLTIGPRFPYDPNPPNTPEISGYHGHDHIRIYLTERSYDAESGMKGYQYSIGTSPGSTDIRSWPDADEIDYQGTMSHLNRSNSMTTPYIEISKDDLPQDQPLYFNVKGINNQNTETNVVATGPVFLDNEPPEEPVVSLSIKNGDKLEIDVSNIYDSVSGVESVEAFVEYPDVPYHLITINWLDIGNLTSVRSDNFSVNTIYQPDPAYSIYDLNVHIRITNAAGLQTTVTENVPAPTLNFTPTQTYQIGF